jgi:hypothetical protein
MNNQFTVKVSQLKGLVELAGKKDVRYYLNGVRVEFRHDLTRLIACEGHILGLLNIPSENQGLGALTIPRAFIEGLPKATKKSDPLMTISQDSQNHTFWHCEYDNIKTSFYEIEGKYPDYTRVLSGIKTSGKPSQFNDQFLAAFKKCGLALTFLHKDHFFSEILHNDNSSCLVELPTLKGQFIGVIMPLKSDHVEAASVDPAIYAPVIQEITAPNLGLITDSEKLAA